MRVGNARRTGSAYCTAVSICSCSAMPSSRSSGTGSLKVIIHTLPIWRSTPSGMPTRSVHRGSRTLQSGAASPTSRTISLRPWNGLSFSALALAVGGSIDSAQRTLRSSRNRRRSAAASAGETGCPSVNSRPPVRVVPESSKGRPASACSLASAPEGNSPGTAAYGCSISRIRETSCAAATAAQAASSVTSPNRHISRCSM